MNLLGTVSGALIALIVTICYILVISFTIWMAIDAGKQDRFWWLTLVLGLPVIGPAVYYFTEKKHEYVKIPPHHIHKSLTEEQHETNHRKKKSRKEKKETKVVEEVSKEEIKPEVANVETAKEEIKQEQPVVIDTPKEGDAVTEEVKSVA